MAKHWQACPTRHCLRDLVIASPEARVDEIMNPQPVTVSPETDQEEVAHLVSRYDYLSIPAVNEDGRMLGVIPVFGHLWDILRKVR